jgi:hypothetical protein
VFCSIGDVKYVSVSLLKIP